MVDSNNICVLCHEDCLNGQCSEGGNAAACTECASSTKFLNSGSCVLASACVGGTEKLNKNIFLYSCNIC